MDDIRLRISRARQRVTAVPDIFIDEYMKDANGEFVKIYLYLLRCLSRDDGSFSVSAMGLITLEFDGKEELIGITLVDITGDYPETSAEKAPVPAGDDAVALTCGNRPRGGAPVGKAAEEERPAPALEKDHDPVEIAAAADEDEEIRDTLQAAEIYLGRPVTPQETAKFYSWYPRPDFPPDRILHRGRPPGFFLYECGRPSVDGKGLQDPGGGRDLREGLLDYLPGRGQGIWHIGPEPLRRGDRLCGQVGDRIRLSSG